MLIFHWTKKKYFVLRNSKAQYEVYIGLDLWSYITDIYLILKIYILKHLSSYGLHFFTYTVVQNIPFN